MDKGDSNRKDNPKAYKCWENMLYRCRVSDTLSVCDEWLDFTVFLEWYNNNYKSGLYLTKEFGHYSPSTAYFSKKETLTGKCFIFEHSTGRVAEVYNRAEFARENNLDPSALTRLVKGKQKTHKGWTFTGEIGG